MLAARPSQEIDSLRSMVLGIVETGNEEGVAAGSLVVAPQPDKKSEQLQQEVLELKSSKEQMEGMVIEMRNYMREIEGRMSKADDNTSKLLDR